MTHGSKPTYLFKLRNLSAPYWLQEAVAESADTNRIIHSSPCLTAVKNLCPHVDTNITVLSLFCLYHKDMKHVETCFPPGVRQPEGLQNSRLTSSMMGVDKK